MSNLRSRSFRLFMLGAVICLIGILFAWRVSRRTQASDLRGAKLTLISLPGLKESEWDLRISLTQWTEPYLIVHFWASWCQPCREEFPSMIQASSLLPASVKMITVSADQDPQAGLQFLQMFEGSEKLVSLWDSKQELSLSWGTDKLPETYILGPERQLIRKIGGTMNWVDPINLQFLQNLGQK